MKHTIELHKQHIPRHLLFLDALGAVLVAAGVLDLLDTGFQLLPAWLRLPGMGVMLVVLGSAMMLSVPVWLLRRHRRRNGHPEDRPGAGGGPRA
jgi:hypothetical protein